jgi:hypothetical protein
MSRPAEGGVSNEPVHGGLELPSVTIVNYSLDLQDRHGFVGDRASQTAFRTVLEQWRAKARKSGVDPLGHVDDPRLSKSRLDRLWKAGGEAGALIDSAADEFAHHFADVIKLFLQQDGWKSVKRIVVGGGFRDSKVGRHTLRHTGVLLRREEIDIELQTLHHAADDGGLIGWVHLVPAPLLKAHDAILAVDIGGTNARCGIVVTHVGEASDLSKAEVVKRHKWRHRSEEPMRKDLVEGLVEMLEDLIAHAKKAGLRLAPFIGVACPGLIGEDGSIDRGAHNLPGDWHGEGFHLPRRLAKKIPHIGLEDTLVLMHNDAVVQGLSELPFMQDVKRWAVMTIGTGLGNASYRNTN